MNGFDESNIVSGKIRYMGTLDVSIYTIYQHDNMKYKAKINARPGLPKVVYVIINIFLIIQLIGPCFFVDSTIFMISLLLPKIEYSKVKGSTFS